MAKEKQHLNFLDKIIGFFSPQARLKRQGYRLALQDLEKRRYEGASTGRRVEGWITSDTSVNQEAKLSLSRLRQRSRDLVRNNPYARAGINAIAGETIGKGIIGQIKADKKNLQADVENIWKQWALTKACDFEGRHNLYGLQNVVMKTIAEGGELIIRKRFVDDDSLPVPFQIQILEGDFVDYTKEQETKPLIKQGIEFDPLGRRTAYWMFQEHPGDGTGNTTLVRVPADEVLHIYKVERSGQIRGIPWLAPCIVRLRDLDEYEDAQLVRQKIAACFTGIVHDITDPVDPPTNGVSNKIGERVQPGQWEHLPPGKTVTFSSPPTVENYKEYLSVNLHAIATGLGVTYEVLTGDYSEVNFSSARMGWLKFQRNIDSWRCNILMPQFLNPMFSWFKEVLILSTGKNLDGVSISWTPPKREMVDPTKEIPALVDAVRSGFMSYSEVVRMYGFDPTELLDEIKGDAEMIDARKLIFDSDPRKTKQNGDLQLTSSESSP